MSAWQTAPRSAEEVRAAVEDVLARGELRTQESLLARLLEWLDLDLGRAGDGLTEIVPWILLVVLLAALTALVLRAWQTFRAPHLAEAQAARAVTQDARGRARELARAGRAARAAGDLRAALRLELEALFLFLGGRGDLELNPARTQRELLRRSTRAVRERLQPLVRAFEPKEFGRAPVEPADLERLEAELAPLERDAEQR
ncbi:MAG TPA: hypothetical protein VF530_03175 [Planctomycetota bacterium]